MPAGATRASAVPSWRELLVPAALGWAIARCCLALGQLLSRRLVDVLPPPLGNRPFEDGLLVWDGVFYRMLATDWYSTARPDAARFFPLYPGLGRALAPLVGGNEELALLLVSNVSALLGAVLVGRLTAEVTGDGAAARRVTWIVALFPSAFVLAFAYTEALALVLTAGTLLALHRRAFLVAGLLAFGCALLRPVGGLVLVPIVVELYRHRRHTTWWQGAVAVLGPLGGLGTALWWISRSTGDLLLPVDEQSKLRGGFQDPVTRMLEPVGELLRGNTKDVYNLLFMWLLLALLVVAIRRRQPLSWTTFAGASLLVLYSSQVTDSVGRYGLLIVPLLVALAQWAEARWRVVLVAALGCSGLVWLSTLAWLGRVVP